MKVTENQIIFENQREKEVFLMLLKEVNISELRSELCFESVDMIDKILRGL